MALHYNNSRRYENNNIIIIISRPPVSILRTNRWAQWCRTTAERDYSTTTTTTTPFCIVAALASCLTHPAYTSYNTYIYPSIRVYTLLHHIIYYYLFDERTHIRYIPTRGIAAENARRADGGGELMTTMAYGYPPQYVYPIICYAGLT